MKCFFCKKLTEVESYYGVKLNICHKCNLTFLPKNKFLEIIANVRKKYPRQYFSPKFQKKLYQNKIFENYITPFTICPNCHKQTYTKIHSLNMIFDYCKHCKIMVLDIINLDKNFQFILNKRSIFWKFYNILSLIITNVFKKVFLRRN